MRLVTVFTGLCLTACAQSSGQGVLALPMDVQLLTAPPSTPATYLNLTVDASANGGDFIDAVSPSPQVLISLILPNGTEVTAGNASTFGFSVLQQTNGPGTAVTSGVFTPFDALGTHTTFILPAGSPGGVYQVKANSSMVATSTSMSATYFSMSGVKSGIAKDKLVYNPGGNVTLTAFIFSGPAQVTGAAVSATIVPPVSLNTEATISNYQVVNQTSNGGFTQYIYQASLTNTSNGTFTTAIAKLVNVPSTVTLIDAGTLGFANVPASASTTSVNTFSVQVPTGQTFDPTTLSWDINATGAPTTLALPDSGGGNYTGVYTPSVPGMYQALVNITGTFAGAAFARTLSTTFQVVNPVATLSAITDTVAPNAAGLPDHLVLSAQVNVQTAGSYFFNVTLVASNGKMTTATGSASLSTGSGHIDAGLSEQQILGLGVNGPYEKVRAAVSQLPASGNPVSVGFIADAGPTAAYSPAILNRGSLYFTGQNSASGVVTGSGPTFDLLQVTIGVFNRTRGTCDWQATLTDLNGNQIDFSSATGNVAAGSTSVTLNFNGNLIARSVNGPYLTKDAAIHCGTNQATAQTLFQTQSFMTSQFTSVAGDFSLSVVSTPPAGPPGSSFSFGIAATSIGAFGNSINLTVSGLPSGASGVFSVPTLPGFGPSTLIVTTTGSTPPGNYSLNITGSSGTLSHVVTVTLMVTAS